MARRTAFSFLFFAFTTLGGAVGAATLTTAELTLNDLIITEYLADPIGVSDSLGEYFELFNATDSDVDLAGLMIRDDGSNAFTVTAATISAGGFAVFSSSDGMSLGLTPDYVYGGSMSLTNTDDEIGLFRPDDTLINKIAYTDGDFFGDGIAHELAALDRATSTLLVGPASGSDFLAATSGLPLGNFGSPGFAGGTAMDMPAVPIPAAVWMFGSALSILGWIRRKNSGHLNSPRKGDPHAKLPGPSGFDCIDADRLGAGTVGGV